MLASCLKPPVIRSRRCWIIFKPTIYLRRGSGSPIRLFDSLPESEQEQLVELRRLRENARIGAPDLVLAKSANPKRKQHRFSKLEDDLIVRFVKAGRSASEIAVALARKPSTIHIRYNDHLRYHYPDAPRDAFKANVGRRKAFSDDEEFCKKVYQLVSEGASLKHLATKLGVAPGTIHRCYNAVCLPGERSSGSSNRFFDERELELIRQCIRERSSLPALAKRLNRTTASIKACIARRKLNPRADRTYRRFAQDEDVALRSAYDDGSSITDIAKQLGRQEQSVRARLKFIQFQTAVSKPAPIWSAEERREAVRLHDLGKSSAAIGRHLGRSIRAVRNNIAEELVRLQRESIVPRTQWSPNKVSQLLKLRDDDELEWHAIAAEIGTTEAAAMNVYHNSKRHPCMSWRPEQISKLLELRDGEGLTWNAVAKELGETVGAVKVRYYRSIHEGQFYYVPKRKWMAEEYSRLLKLRDGENLGWEAVAKEMGRTTDAVQKQYRKIRSRQPDRVTNGKWTAEQYSRLLKLRDGENLGWEAVAKEMGRTTDAVQKQYRKIRSRQPDCVTNGKWTAEEDSGVLKLRDGENLGWDAVAKETGRTVPAVVSRYYKLKRVRQPDYMYVAKRKWTAEKDSQLLKLRDSEKLGWFAVAKELGKTIFGTRMRYYRIKGGQPNCGPCRNWTAEEDSRLLKFRSVKNLRWDNRKNLAWEAVAKELGRTVAAVKSRYYHYATKSGEADSTAPS